MKQGLVLLTLFLAKTCFGQNPIHTDTSSKILDSVFSVRKADNLKIFDVAGVYFCSNGFSGYRLILDSNQTFQKVGFDCMSHSTVDIGRWDLQLGTTLILKSNHTIKTFNIFKLDSYYFIVSNEQKEKFLYDFVEAKKLFRNAKPLIVDDKTFSVEHMIGFSLTDKYFAKEFDDPSGS